MLVMNDRAQLQLAAIQYERGFDIDRLLIEACSVLARRGRALGGLLQISTGERGGNCASSVHVVDLRTGRRFDIWQDLGPCARGCRLDEGGLGAAQAVLHEAVTEKVDLLIVNRFGRAESLGKGLRPAIEAAVAEGIPVLTAVREPYTDSWRQFHGGFGSELPSVVAPIIAWANHVRAGDHSLPR